MGPLDMALYGTYDSGLVMRELLEHGQHYEQGASSRQLGCQNGPIRVSVAVLFSPLYDADSYAGDVKKEWGLFLFAQKAFLELESYSMYPSWRTEGFFTNLKLCCTYNSSLLLPSSGPK